MRMTAIITQPFKYDMGCQLGNTKNLYGKDRRRQLLYYVNLIRACKKVPYQLVYIGKKFVFLKEPLFL